MMAAVAGRGRGRALTLDELRAAGVPGVQIRDDDLVGGRRVHRAVAGLLQLHQVDVAPALVRRVVQRVRDRRAGGGDLLEEALPLDAVVLHVRFGALGPAALRVNHVWVLVRAVGVVLLAPDGHKAVQCRLCARGDRDGSEFGRGVAAGSVNGAGVGKLNVVRVCASTNNVLSQQRVESCCEWRMLGAHRGRPGRA